MIIVRYVENKLTIYLDGDSAAKYRRYYGNTRFDIIAQDRQINVIPNESGRYTFYDVPNSHGAMKVAGQSKTLFNIPRFGNVKYDNPDYREDGIYMTLPEHLPEHVKRSTRKKKTKAVATTKQFQHTSDDVVRDLERIPVQRNRQKVTIESDEDVHMAVLYRGQDYHLKVAPDQLLGLTLQLLDQNPN